MAYFYILCSPATISILSTLLVLQEDIITITEKHVILSIISTLDGSNTIYNKELNEIYHSRYGAIAESMHVFIQSGLEAIPRAEGISILEIGFGTGLNAFLSMIHSTFDRTIYMALEPFPLPANLIAQLNYSQTLNKPEMEPAFELLHTCKWEIPVNITKGFYLHKMKESLLTIMLPPNQFNLVYFDAFSPDKQPELWTEETFKRIYNSMKPEGILVTYSSKGIVRRAMQAVGFNVDRIPGPLGKYEMIKAIKH